MGALEVILAIGAFAVGVFGNLVADDLRDAIPRLSERIVERAVRCLPVEMQERMREEWLADLNSSGGKINMLVSAVGMHFGAQKIQYSQLRRNVSVSQKINTNSMTKALNEGFEKGLKRGDYIRDYILFTCIITLYHFVKFIIETIFRWDKKK